MDPPITPGRILACQPDDESSDAGRNGERPLRARGKSRDSPARSARSAGRSAGRSTWRRRTAMRGILAAVTVVRKILVEAVDDLLGTYRSFEEHKSAGLRLPILLESSDPRL